MKVHCGRLIVALICIFNVTAISGRTIAARKWAASNTFCFGKRGNVPTTFIRTRCIRHNNRGVPTEFSQAQQNQCWLDTRGGSSSIEKPTIEDYSDEGSSSSSAIFSTFENEVHRLGASHRTEIRSVFHKFLSEVEYLHTHCNFSDGERDSDYCEEESFSDVGVEKSGEEERVPKGNIDEIASSGFTTVRENENKSDSPVVGYLSGSLMNDMGNWLVNNGGFVAFYISLYCAMIWLIQMVLQKLTPLKR